MVRKVSLLVGLLFLFSLAAGTRASAQDKVELYGGYSFFHLENSPGANNLNGFILSGEYKFAPWFGAVGEVGGDYGGGSSVTTYLTTPLRRPWDSGLMRRSRRHLSGGSSRAIM
jgi:hypothetical protein